MMTFCLVEKKMELRCLDLFSGIGGFSLALQSICKTVAYCDIDDGCRCILQKLVDEHKLHKAPILSDITQITLKDIRELKPNMITAGFPCTDISSANPTGLGIKGIRSGLFHEVLRIIDMSPQISVVLLENSPRIMQKGFALIERMLVKRGFHLKYCLIEATGVGAFHRRKRWYCLCYKKHALPLPQIDPIFLRYRWTTIKYTPHLTVIKSPFHKSNCTNRLEKLGNSVVPQCAAHAWNSLVAAAHLGTNTSVVNVSPLRISRTLDITISDGTNTYRKKYWATPTHSVWFHNKRLSVRASTILSNQLYYDVNNKIHNKLQNRHNYIANPLFIEQLMGYPKNWTA